MTWILENLGTILVGLFLLLVVFGIVRKMIQDRKKGNSSCGCGCSGCAMAGSCHKQ